MNLKDIPKKLLGPEYYMEYENKDVRLSVSKINDFIETLGDSAVSLIYSNKEEYHNVDNRLLNIIRRIHIRHAIIDLNNCFDILLQVPWFHYRIWNTILAESTVTRKLIKENMILLEIVKDG